MSDPRIRLRDKLCREIAQAEHDARIHARREAGRLGDVAPGRALLAIAEHAAEIEPVLAKLTHQPLGRHLSRAVADVVSAARHFLFDRLLDSARSYRVTLLGLKHGVDATRLLREVVTLTGDVALLKFCDLVLVERLCLIEDAEQALAWFAEHSELALQSGGRRLTLPAPATQAAVFAVKL
ncbi:MAG: hypothetical protein ABI591_21120 [Kofleriaceae bacterium]